MYERLTSAKAFAKDVFINQERKLGDRRRLDTVVVLTINYADSGSVGVLSYDPIGTVGEIKVFGFWGVYGRKAET